MNHFDDITPDNRWKNEVLEELRKMNANLAKLVDSLQPEKNKKGVKK